MATDDKKGAEAYILKQTQWENLPTNIKQLMGNNKETWRQAVIKYSLQHQLRWKTNAVRTAMADERVYYNELIKYSRTHLMLYPYHLSDVLVKGLKVTAFKYYWDMMAQIMEEERSYDTLPNFTAADCVRLLGIGRNQYIDIMNKCRQKTWIWVRKTSLIKDSLPSEPVKVDCDYWWVVNIGYISEEDIKHCEVKEREVIDSLIDHGSRKAGEYPRRIVFSLYRKGLVYFDVPIDDNDQIIVPPLEGFVMNRVLGDYFENLLYKIFVSIDERTTISQLASVLQMDIDMVKMAVSVYIRLGFAKKKSVDLAPTLEGSLTPVITSDGVIVNEAPELAPWHPSWYKTVRFRDTERVSNNSIKCPSKSEDLAAEFQKETESTAKHRVGFIFDSTITAYLMMGNLASGLKTHAVTMFEVGKLADEVMDDFLEQLDTVENVSEGEAQTYFDHAICLRNTIRFLRYNRNCPVKGSDGGLDLLRCERLESLEPETRLRILQKNYSLLISMAPISEDTHSITTAIPRHFGPSIAEMNSPWFKLYLYSVALSGVPTQLYPRGTRVRKLPSFLLEFEYYLITTWHHDGTVVASNGALASLNDMLLSSPVMIQGYSMESDVPETKDIPFPFVTFRKQLSSSAQDSEKENENRIQTQGSSDFTYETTNVAEFDTEEETKWLKACPFLERVADALDVQKSFGYIRLIKITGHWSPQTNGWVLLSLHHGIPLFDISLNREICKRVALFKLFSGEAIDAFSKSSRVNCLKLLDFVATNRTVPLESDITHNLPLPTNLVEFSKTIY